MKILVGTDTKVYHDGKICRDIPAVVLAHRAGGIKVKFTLPDWAGSEELSIWTRRRRPGVYEVIGYNFWLYTRELQ